MSHRHNYLDNEIERLQALDQQITRRADDLEEAYTHAEAVCDRLVEFLTALRDAAVEVTAPDGHPRGQVADAATAFLADELKARLNDVVEVLDTWSTP